MEIFMPVGMRILVALYWIAGLSGIMIGVLAVNQGFYETFYDVQSLLIAQGTAILALGSIVFLVAIGMVSGAKWAVGIAKMISGVLVGWAAIGTVLGVYTAYDVSALDSTFILYGMVAWLLIFGIGTGLLGLAYLQRQGSTVRRYSEYVTTETYSPQPARTEPKRLPAVAKRNVIRCLDCGTELKPGTSYCPACGAPQNV
jgi:zinc-ribbon domain